MVLDKARHDEIPTGDRAILHYARRLTLQPASVVRDDVLTLREAGFSDRAIHDICQLVAYFNFVNRMADGLGVTLEDA